MSKNRTVKTPYWAILLVGLLSVGACQQNNDLHGYVEGRLTYLSAPTDGRLIQINVQRGQLVKQGDALFSLETLPEEADLKSANALLDEAIANLENLQKGKRPTEIAEIEERIAEAKAKVIFTQKEYDRNKTLVLKAALDKRQLDQTVQDLNESIANLNALTESLKTAKLAAREDEVIAAKARLESARALSSKQHWFVGEKSVVAPVDAEVFDTYYQLGERVPAKIPVVSLLAPGDIKVIFFIPEPELATVHLNQIISIGCDHCTTTVTAKIAFISPKAEFTPPVIYSEQSRSKLVYRVEARFSPEDQGKVHPGQPVDIFLNGKK